MRFKEGKKVIVHFEAIIESTEPEGMMVRVEREDGDRIWVYKGDCLEPTASFLVGNLVLWKGKEEDLFQGVVEKVHVGSELIDVVVGSKRFTVPSKECKILKR